MTAAPIPTAFPQCVTGLLVRGQGAHRIAQGLSVTAAPTSGALLTPSSLGLLGCGAGRPQCRPMANCDGCAYLSPAFTQCVTGLRGPGARSVAQGLSMTISTTSVRSVAHSLLAGLRGRAPTVSAKG